MLTLPVISHKGLVLVICLARPLVPGSSATATRGGTNPIQYGMGTSVGSVDTNMTQGTNSTGIATDVAIRW